VLADIINEHNATEREIRLNVNLTEELQKVKDYLAADDASSAAVKAKMETKNLYHETFLLRVVSMLDFYCSLTVISPATLSMVHKFSSP